MYGNMLRHLNCMHPKAYMLFQKWNKRRKVLEKSPKQPVTRPGWIKKFLKRLDYKRCQCTICHNVLRMPPGDHSNLKRHVRKKHPFYYERELNAYKETQKRTKMQRESELVVYMLKEVDSNDPLQSIDALNVSETHDSDVNESDVSDVDTEASEIPKDIGCNETVDVENLETLNEDDPDIEEKIKQLCNKNTTDQSICSGHRQKTCFWNFFISVNDYNLYKCMFCLKNIAIFPRSISNLKRHIANIHPKECMLIFKHAPQYDTCRIKK